MAFRLLVENYRALRRIDWDLPTGVCGLVGPNGSGKTTLLDVPVVLRDVFANGIWPGLTQHGDLQTMRNLHASPGEAVKLEVWLDAIHWGIEVAVDEAPGKETYAETIRDGGQLVLDKRHDANSFRYQERDFQASAGAFRIFAQDKYASGPAGLLRPPISHLIQYRLYHPYNLSRIREGSAPGIETVLLSQCDNVFTLLRNWRDRRATRKRYQFVIDGLTEAFPDIFEELELEQMGAQSNTSTITARVFAPGGKVSLPIRYAPSGLLTGLLHLAAVASTEPGGVVAIDEPENGLHPYAVKCIVQAMRDWAAQEQITVLLATHSPMLLDQFKRDPEHLFVMEPGQEVLPIPLDQVRDREWLSRFSLGDLYKTGDFGAPQEGAAA
jgi:predicted ATPase